MGWDILQPRLAGRRGGMSRVYLWLELLIQPTWRWLIMSPLAALGTAQAVRDELLSTAEAEKYRLLALVPEWPWEWYAIGFLVLTLGLLLEAAYRAVSAERAKISQMKNLLPMSLNFVQPILHIGINTKRKSQSNMQSGLLFENVGHRPIKYQMESYKSDFGLGQKAPGNLFQNGGIIVPGGKTEFKIPGTQNINASTQSLTGRIKYRVTYGYFDGEQAFYEEREIDVTCYKSNKSVRGYDGVSYLIVDEKFGWLDGTR